MKQLLKDVVATEQLLKETKVGVAVSKLRNHSAKDVADLSKVIVKKWKGEVHVGDKPKTKTPAVAAIKTENPSGTPSPSRQETPSTPVNVPHKVVPGAKPGAPRTTKTDGVTIVTLGDKVRDKCLEMVYDALANDSRYPSEQLLKKAQAVEGEVYREFRAVNAAYRNKMRRLFLNLKDKNNPQLREFIVSGDLPIPKFCTMSVQEMASEERKEADAQLMEDNLFKSLGAGEQEAETDAFQCGRCKERKTRYRQAQTRSADEPMTTFVTCVNCGNRWKFS
ncbi:transcription factor S-II, central domain-containing protein [Cantharellus anzutake]|uniref:transcription factor S-II, central domain-containing protein n=2 Tax=Cantharellus anzutake TaxID=1750568 RepID=UPI001903C25E|nr:transcription factor S-II, central domain-containing protein [Cantharellus anzutake]KAF8314116.1 transcription factor S-II, central domain-containing protein [Cantharellus anzutake]